MNSKQKDNIKPTKLPKGVRLTAAKNRLCVYSLQGDALFKKGKQGRRYYLPKKFFGFLL
jgi:hypothetical protein